VYSYTPDSSQNSINLIILVILIVSTFLVPPTMLGLKYTFISLPLLIFALVLFILTRGRHKLKISRKSVVLLVTIWVYYFYLCIQSVYFDGYFKIDYLKSIVSITIFIVVFSIVFSDFAIRYLYFKLFVGVLLFFVVSNIFTITLSLLIGAEKLLIFEIPMYEDTYKLQVFFPFTVTFGRMNFFGDIVMRLSALFREPGIAQAFYIWAFVISHRYYKSKLVKPLLLLGTIMTLSTTGFVLLAAVIFLTAVLEKFNVKRILLSSLFVLLAGGVYLVVPGLSLESKNAESYEARVGKLEQANDLFIENPLFGTGASNAFIEGTSTSLLQQAYAIGGVGVLLFLVICFIGFIFELRDWKVYLLSIFPVISTALIAQPIYDTSILYLFVLASHTYPIRTR
jgi:hypothetical protein